MLELCNGLTVTPLLLPLNPKVSITLLKHPALPIAHLTSSVHHILPGDNRLSVAGDGENPSHSHCSHKKEEEKVRGFQFGLDSNCNLRRSSSAGLLLCRPSPAIQYGCRG